jgi:hypothetical protein
MKFLSGFIVGILATIFSLFVISSATNHDDALASGETLSGLTTLPSKGKCIMKGEKVKIFQTLRPNIALATSGNYQDEILALLVNYDGDIYYDNLEINMPKDKCARQFGTYQYETKDSILKTVPAVIIE